MNVLMWKCVLDINLVMSCFFFLSVCVFAVCVCVSLHCRVCVCVCVCVCVMSAITQRGSDTPLCLIPSSNPPVSRHCCREDRTSVHTHQSYMSFFLYFSLTHTHTHTHTHTLISTHKISAHTSEDTCVNAHRQGSLHQISYKPTAYYSVAHNFICSR